MRNGSLVLRCDPRPRLLGFLRGPVTGRRLCFRPAGAEENRLLPAPPSLGGSLNAATKLNGWQLSAIHARHECCALTEPDACQAVRVERRRGRRRRCRKRSRVGGGAVVRTEVRTWYIPARQAMQGWDTPYAMQVCTFGWSASQSLNPGVVGLQLGLCVRLGVDEARWRSRETTGRELSTITRGLERDGGKIVWLRIHGQLNFVSGWKK